MRDGLNNRKKKNKTSPKTVGPKKKQKKINAHTHDNDTHQKTKIRLEKLDEIQTMAADKTR